MKYYLASRKVEIIKFANKQMQVEKIILSKISQSQKAIGHLFFLMCYGYTIFTYKCRPHPCLRNDSCAETITENHNLSNIMISKYQISEQ